MAQTLIATFADRDDAEGAIDRLEELGYNPKDMSIMMRDSREQEELANDVGADPAGGAASGAVTGAAVGGLAGLVSAYAIPTLGAFFIGGPIAAALGLTGAAAATVSGAATGAVAGGILGALMGLGLSKDDARFYEDRVNEGAILVAVPISDREDSREARDVFEEADAQNIRVISQDSAHRSHAHA